MEIDKQKFKQAVALKENGNLNEAKTLLLQLHEGCPEYVQVLAVLGHVYMKLNQQEDAIIYFKKAINLRPTMEAVSVGLFHCLLKLDRVDDAFNEMRRFLSLSESKEYTQLLADINKGS